MNKKLKLLRGKVLKTLKEGFRSQPDGSALIADLELKRLKIKLWEGWCQQRTLALWRCKEIDCSCVSGPEASMGLLCLLRSPRGVF